MNKDNIALWLKEKFGKACKVAFSKIESTDSIALFGIDSVVLVTIAVDLEEFLGKEIDPTIFYEFDTIEALSTYLIEEILN
jgi:acyl carrier protein